MLSLKLSSRNVTSVVGVLSVILKNKDRILGVGSVENQLKPAGLLMNPGKCELKARKLMQRCYKCSPIRAANPVVKSQKEGSKVGPD